MCNRTEIVTNGCSGACCERFGLPFSYEEFQEMKAKVAKGEYMFTDRKGKYRSVPLSDEITYIADMLIPLGHSNIAVESDYEGQTIVERHKSYYDREPIDGDMNGCDLKEDGQLYGHYFTCKHFDKENRICTAYESRPYFCKSFGVKFECGYRGCGINQTMKRLQDAEQSVKAA